MDPRSRCRSGMVDDDGWVEYDVFLFWSGVTGVIFCEKCGAGAGAGAGVGVRVLIFCRNMLDIAVAGKCW